MFRPKIVDSIQKGYYLQDLLRDAVAGVMVGIVAFPFAVAFAIASGSTPEKGLLTAFIAGFLVAALGGSEVQIAGPTGSFIVIIYGVLQEFGTDGLVLATIMAGIMLVALGIARLGSVIQYIPYPVIIGFTSGISIIIFSTQINDFLGLGLTNIPGDFLSKWSLYLTSLEQVNIPAFLLGAVTVIGILILQKFTPKLPAALFALLFGTAIVLVFRLPVETLGDRFGTIQGSIPLPSLPIINLERIQQLFMPALSIALLVGIESLLTAVVADSMSGFKHRSNTELIAEGIANLVSGLFGGLPATGAIARTAANIRTGGRSPVAGMIHALVLLAIFLFLSPLTAFIPLASLAGILLTVSYNMSEQHTFRMLLKGPVGDILSLVVTFFLTIFLDLTIAIPVGILIALFMFMNKMAGSTQIRYHNDSFLDVPPEMDPFGLTAHKLPTGVQVVEIDGPFFFGAAERLREDLSLSGQVPKVRIIRMREVSSIDASGVKALREILKDANIHNSALIFAAIQYPVRQVFDRIGFTKEIGEHRIAPNVLVALDMSKHLLGKPEKTIAERLRAGGIFNLSCNSAETLIQEVCTRIPFTPDQQKVICTSMIEREKLASTGLGKGLAFPHPRDPVLLDPDQEIICIAYNQTPIDFAALDGKAVHTAIFILSSSVQGHLQTLSRFAHLSSNDEFLNLLHNKSNYDELAAFLADSLKEFKNN